MAKIDVTELDIFYISYDEPNCEENWADLLNKVPWAKRVHGVKGFDAAHKECANQSETDRFITVDGDNIVMDEFFNQELEFPEKDHDGNDISESIFSWNAKNLLNGLVYGNGGLKCWPKEYTKSINTHEAATDGEGMEFCWKLNYIQMNDIFSEVHQTASPFQAFRAGFREGVKLSLDQGRRVEPHKFQDDIWYGNFNRLNVWCNVGTDVENGWWAIYGARLGCEKTVLSDWDTNQISDYDWFKGFFEKEKSYIDNDEHLKQKTIAIGNRLNEEVQGMMLFEPNDQMSKFFKATFVNPKRWGAMITERQIQDLLEKGLIGNT